MKRLFSILIGIIYLSLNLNYVVIASDSKSDNDVDPNIYEKKEIQIKQKNRDKNIQIKELPAEQKQLSFKNVGQSIEEQLVNDLFQTTTTEQNTIIALADNLQLFSDAESKARVEPELEQSPQSSNFLQYLMVSSVAIIIVVLFLVFPRWIKL